MAKAVKKAAKAAPPVEVKEDKAPAEVEEKSCLACKYYSGSLCHRYPPRVWVVRTPVLSASGILYNENPQSFYPSPVVTMPCGEHTKK